VQQIVIPALGDELRHHNGDDFVRLAFLGDFFDVFQQWFDY